MMTIIILSLHALIHIINYFSSFELIIHCYHIHMIEWSKSTRGFQSYHMLLPHSFQGMEQIQYDEFQEFLSKYIIFVLIIILSPLWCIETQTQCLIHIRHVRPNSMGVELNPYHYGASKLKLMSYPFCAIELESIVLSSNIFHYGASGL